MSTTLALLHLEFRVPQADSLKGKRRIVKSFKDRLANRYNVSVAEVDDLDAYRRATLAVAMVANDRTYVESVMSKITNAAGTHRDMILVGQDVEWL